MHIEKVILFTGVTTTMAFSFLIVITRFSTSSACFGGKAKNETDNVTETTTPFPPGKFNKKEYDNYMEEYKRKKEAEREEYLKKQREMDPEAVKKANANLPAGWEDLGMPHDGDDPPPWALSQDLRGIPNLCYLSPAGGNCSQDLKRYAYNDHTKRCLQFRYTGCFGNANNFANTKRCEEVCVDAPKISCAGQDAEQFNKFVIHSYIKYDDYYKDRY